MLKDGRSYWKQVEKLSFKPSIWLLGEVLWYLVKIYSTSSSSSNVTKNQSNWIKYKGNLRWTIGNY